MSSFVGSTATIALLALMVALPSIVATVLGALYIRYVRGTSRQAVIDKAISRAFYVVEDLKSQGKLPKLAEKPAIALEQLHELLSVEGITLTDEMARGAKLIWSAMHSPDAPVQTVNAKAITGFSAEPPAAAAPSSRRVGFAASTLLAMVLGLPSAAHAQATAPGPTAPPVIASTFGGCVGPWTCFQPSVVVTPLAINLRSHVVEAAFQPGLGYGVTFHQGQWYSFGVDVYLDVDPGAQRAALAVLGKAVNGYLRFGWSKGFIGDSNATAPRLLFGIGTDL